MKMVVHAMLLNALWFSVVLGVAHNSLIPAVMVFLVLIFVVLQEGITREDIQALFIGLVFGFLVDGFLHNNGWVHYESWLTIPEWSPPYWILMLWFGFALTLKVGMRWLFRSYLMGTLFLLIGAPLSYFSASKLGAISIHQPLTVMVIIGVSWWAYYSLMYGINKSWRQPYESH